MEGKTRAAGITALVLAVVVGILGGLGLMDMETVATLAGALGFGAIATIAAKTVKKARGPKAALVAFALGLSLSAPAPAMAALPQFDLLGLLNIGFQEISVGHKDYLSLGLRRTPDALLGFDLEPTRVDLVKATCRVPWLKDRVSFLCALGELAAVPE